MAKQIMDGCTAAAYAAYAFSEVATIYPITPIASMGDIAAKWAMQGRKNIFGSALDIKEMESELGAAGATHGALAAGGLATTFTSSQGLMLMIPNMFKIAGEMLPAVFHVGARSLATHALSIFGDHQDIMATRTTGFTMLASASVQEALDLGVIAHIAAINGSLPILHFFDGWRTSNEMNTIDVMDYEQLRPLVDMDKVNAFRARALNPNHPTLIGSAQDPDVYFQNREAPNRFYNDFPAVMQSAMNDFAKAFGRQYHLFDYVGAPDAERIIVTLATSTEVVEEAVNYLNAHGEKTGLVKIRLYRPFSAKDLLAAIPETVIKIAVLDRTKEPGSLGEPIYLDVATAVQASGRNIKIVGGRYGLASKEFNPAMAKAVLDELKKDNPLHGFTIGINDDVTHTSLQYDNRQFIEAPQEQKGCIFYGFGSDGMVGATKQIAQILAGAEKMFAQAYFHYSAKKSGGYTISQLRFGPDPIKEEYSIMASDLVMCSKDTYVKRFEMLKTLKPCGTFILNSAWTADELSRALPAEMRRQIALNKIKFYNINAQAIAAEVGLGVRINTIMETVFLNLIEGIDHDAAITQLKEIVAETYKHEGNEVVNKNMAAIDKAMDALVEVNYPQSWANAQDTPVDATETLPPFITDIAMKCNRLEGDSIPVSALQPAGIMPMGTTAYEKRGIAVNVPLWNPDKCIECTICSLVCSHAAIRPVLINSTEAEKAPQEFVSRPASTAGPLEGLRYRIQVYPLDCTGCASCSVMCPGHALTMVPLASQLPLQENLMEWSKENISEKNNLLPKFSLKGSQLQRPLLQFSGACGGCGETPYVKLLTQLFGTHTIIANATGCSSIWGANFPSNAYCTAADGKGPAWGNSLFEDNAEYAFGMAAAVDTRRQRLLSQAKEYISDTNTEPAVKQALQTWIDSFNDSEKSSDASKNLLDIINKSDNPAAYSIFTESSDMLTCTSVWAVGGDGWAYDIGFAGLDHVLAQNTNINMLVLDTECYSNTGGQASKATPLSAVVKYMPNGKREYKKDLGRMMMTYGTIYVASIALGANYAQAIKALAEAEAYPGPSLVIAYCPCINHGIRSGMSHSIMEEKLAVEAGYWPLYRYNPQLSQQGKEPLIVDSPLPDGNLIDFINGEDRYADMKLVDPTAAAQLQPQLQKREQRIYDILAYSAKNNSI